MEIRNIAIIAHVDHGKTTLVDALLKQTHTFRDNQREMSLELIMDSNDLEKEKGITILAKNTSIFYKGTKINIIDTPGHADFGGEVERTINMADGAILLVDAAEGPLPQTKFVLKQAMQAGLKIILIINKIDKKDARPLEVLHEVENLFLELAQEDSALEFVTLFAVGRDGKVFTSLPEQYTPEMAGNTTPLLETLLAEIPNSAVGQDLPLQLLISTIDGDPYVGKLCIGRVHQGTIHKNQQVSLVSAGKLIGNYRIQKLYTTAGLQRQEVDAVGSGDIATIAGIPDLTIGQTITDPQHPVGLPSIQVSEPTIKISLSPNSSPFAGKEGTYGTSRQLKERLLKEKETNIGLRIEEDPETSGFVVYGRGELHLAVLIEEMRREGYEFEVSKPHVVFKTIDGAVHEPFEEVTIEVDSAYVGAVSEELGKRKGIMLDMHVERGDKTALVYKIASRNLLGVRNSLLTQSRGTLQMHEFFLGYERRGPDMKQLRNGALVAAKPGKALSYGLANAQERGALFVGVGTEVYEGMVVGVASKQQDVEVNVCKAKQLTNNRSSGEGVSIQVSPPVILSLEQCLDFIADDELLEVTPLSLRIRKRVLLLTQRRVLERTHRNM